MIEIATITIKRLGHKINLEGWKDSDSYGYDQMVQCQQCAAEFGLWELIDSARLTVLWRTSAGVLTINVCDFYNSVDMPLNILDTDEWFICQKLKSFF